MQGTQASSAHKEDLGLEDSPDPLETQEAMEPGATLELMVTQAPPVLRVTGELLVSMDIKDSSEHQATQGAPETSVCRERTEKMVGGAFLE